MICKEKIYFKSEILPGFSQKRMCDLFKFRFRRKTGKGSNLIFSLKIIHTYQNIRSSATGITHQ